MQTCAPATNLTDRLRTLALRGLPRMYLPDRRRFVFRVRRTDNGLATEGVSYRYTAITLIGLACETPDVAAEILHGHAPRAVLDDLLTELPRVTNIGDAAAALWAAALNDHPAAEKAHTVLGERLNHADELPTVELSWVVTALSLGPESRQRHTLRERVARLLLSAFDTRANLFRHHVDDAGGLRSHVACFADIVYPVQALSYYHVRTGSAEALSAAARCAQRACERIGPAGQWWWHYDARTGEVVEGYPVYSVHQDAMAPMALFALADAGGPLHRTALQHGLDWLAAAPELAGGSLMDEDAGFIWRKVARREPRKLVRSAQAIATRLHRSLRVPGVDTLFPAGTIDDECRPYHLGWLLHAWPTRRAADWGTEEAAE